MTLVLRTRIRIPVIATVIIITITTMIIQRLRHIGVAIVTEVLHFEDFLSRRHFIKCSV